MSLRIVAFILNGLVLLFALLVLLSGNICGTVIGFLAAGYNFYALRSGVDADSGCLNILGFGANALIFVSGAIGVFTGVGLLSGSGTSGFDGLANGIAGLIVLVISVVYMSAGIVTAVSMAREP